MIDKALTACMLILLIMAIVVGGLLTMQIVSLIFFGQPIAQLLGTA